MTPGVLEYTEEADEDLLQIHEWLERISPQLADQTIRQLDTECRKVAEAPGLGTRCDEIRPRTLKWIYRT